MEYINSKNFDNTIYYVEPNIIQYILELDSYK